MARARKVEVFVITRRDEDGTAWLMPTMGWWSGPFEARTFVTPGLANYVAARINAKPKQPDHETGPARVKRREMAAGFKEWINGKGK